MTRHPPMFSDKCDRCKKDKPATTAVVCWLGCTHMQCRECAAQTAKEAKPIP